MGTFLAFLVGWAMGSRGGEQQYDDVIAAAKEVRDSDEFATLLGALRTHATFLLRQAADWLESSESRATDRTDVVSRVRAMVQPRDAGGASSED